MLAGDAILNAVLRGPSGSISGMIENTHIARIDPETLEVFRARAEAGTVSC